jgi:hypothetical protein
VTETTPAYTVPAYARDCVRRASGLVLTAHSERTAKAQEVRIWEAWRPKVVSPVKRRSRLAGTRQDGRAVGARSDLLKTPRERAEREIVSAKEFT